MCVCCVYVCMCICIQTRLNGIFKYFICLARESHYIVRLALCHTLPPQLPEYWFTSMCYPSRLQFNLFMIQAASDPAGPLGADPCQSPSHYSHLEEGLAGVCRVLTDGTSDKRPLQMAYVCLKWEMCSSQMLCECVKALQSDLQVPSNAMSMF